MSNLKALKAIYYQLAFKSGLEIAGVDKNKPLWIGVGKNWELYGILLSQHNLQ